MVTGADAGYTTEYSPINRHVSTSGPLIAIPHTFYSVVNKPTHEILLHPCKQPFNRNSHLQVVFGVCKRWVKKLYWWYVPGFLSRRAWEALFWLFLPLRWRRGSSKTRCTTSRLILWLVGYLVLLKHFSCFFQTQETRTLWANKTLLDHLLLRAASSWWRMWTPNILVPHF